MVHIWQIKLGNRLEISLIESPASREISDFLALLPNNKLATMNARWMKSNKTALQARKSNI